MPKATQSRKRSKPYSASPSPSPDAKPHISESDEDTKPQHNNTKSAKSKAAPKGETNGGAAPARKWTAAEYRALFNHAVPKVPMSAWNGVLPDRTALQCDRAWKRVLPKVLKMLEEAE